jgi:hypothetical protein
MSPSENLSGNGGPAFQKFQTLQVPQKQFGEPVAFWFTAIRMETSRPAGN